MKSFVSLSAAGPHPLKVLARGKDGSVVVEHPVLCVGELDLSLTSGGSPVRWNVTRETLKEIADNSKRWTWPVNVYPSPHRKVSETHGPSPGFVESLTARGDVLIARIKLTGYLAEEVLADRWRGFSGDFTKSPTLPSGKFEGWVMWGGVYTNKPAAGFSIRIESEQTAAAAAAWNAEETFSVALEIATEHDGSEKGSSMKTVEELTLEVASLEAKLKETNEKVASLTSENEKLRNDVVSANRSAAEKASLSANFETEVRTRDERVRVLEAANASLSTKVSTLEVENRTLTANLQTEKDAVLRKEVIGTINAALASGVAAKAFEGASDDPVKWFRDRFVSLETFRSFVSALPTTSAKNASASSGSNDIIASDEIASLSADEKERVASASGGTGNYADCASLADFKARRAQIEKGKQTRA